MAVLADFRTDVAVVGGGGHVGLPLALTFADSGLKTLVFDVNRSVVESIRAGRMPFLEQGADEMLRRALEREMLTASHVPDGLADCRFVVLIIGTPVDEHLNPTFDAIHRALENCLQFLRDGQILILRSTVYPGTTEHIQRFVRDKGLAIDVAFCPERVAQGHSLREFRELPQIVSAFRPECAAAARGLFARFTSDFVEMTPMEAELCKLMTNAWRYIQFATVNQFYTIATEHGLDFDRILHGCRYNYPRMAGMPGPGFAAGPCLVKDTMQLASFAMNGFVLGHAAMLINEGLPAHVIDLAKRQVNLKDATVGILGMTFKADSDDKRDSLSYKLRKLLRLEARRVLCTDPYLQDPSFVPLETVLAEAQVIFVGTPHKAYEALEIPSTTKVFDIWKQVARNQ